MNIISSACCIQLLQSPTVIGCCSAVRMIRERLLVLAAAMLLLARLSEHQLSESRSTIAFCISLLFSNLSDISAITQASCRHPCLKSHVDAPTSLVNNFLS